MGEHPNVAIARVAIEAFTKGDLDTFTASLHDDVVWHAPGNNPSSGDFRGKAKTLERFRRQQEAGVSWSFDIHDVVGGDEHVVALISAHIVGPGGETTTPSAFIMHVRDGKLAEFWAMNEHQDEVDLVVGG
jgi:ketosteroid isomerase-like protein